MSFWPIAVIALIAQPAAAFTDALNAPGASERLLYLALLLAGILVFSRRRVARGSMLKMAAGWVAIFAAAMIAYSFRDEARTVYERLRGEAEPSVAILRADGEVELRKSRDGHFRATAEVNGATLAMLIDTGASHVLLSYEDARAAGIDPDALAFTQPVSTANGRTFVASVRLARIAVGTVELSGVQAAVAAEGAIKTSLLGMSFLGQLSETSFRGDRLILRN